MYAVLCSTVFWQEIEQAILSKEEQIVFKAIGDDIDVNSEFEKISRTHIKHLIIDLTSIQDVKSLQNCIGRYRVLNDKTQIIIIAPNVTAPNSLMDALVKMGIYDIYNPQSQDENLSDITLLPALVEMIDKPLTYKKAVRWVSDFNTKEVDNKTNNNKLRRHKDIQSETRIEEKVQIIEKEVTRDVEVLGDSVITLASNAPTGKTYLGWNLAHAFSQLDYKIAYVNIDSFNSSNFFFGIEFNDDDPPFENITSKNKNLQDIVNSGYILNNIVVYTGEFGKPSSISKEVFSKLLGKLRADNDIVIIDPPSGITENLMIALQYSNTVLFVSDLDYSHLEMNLRLLSKIGPLLNKNKTIAVINNIQEGSNKLKKVERVLREEDHFKEIVKIRNAGVTTYDYINTHTCNYLEDNAGFTEDFKVLLNVLRVRNYKSQKKKNLIKRLLKM